MIVELPFLEQFREPLRTGRKTMTTRTERFATSGDRFVAFDTVFVVDRVWQIRLADVANLYWRQEGVGSPGEFIDLWKRLHPRAGFVPDEAVWVHEFHRVGVSR